MWKTTVQFPSLLANSSSLAETSRHWAALRGNFETDLQIHVVHQPETYESPDSGADRIDRNSIFCGRDEGLTKRRFDRTQVHIPIWYGLTDEQVEYITESIRRGW